MVLGNTGYSTYLALQDARDLAARKVSAATHAVGSDIVEIERLNNGIAQNLSRDQNLLKPFIAKDRAAVGAFLKAILLSTGNTGFITITDDKGAVFFSTETPLKFGANDRIKSIGLDHALLQQDHWTGYVQFPQTDELTISSIFPFEGKVKAAGAVIVSQPFSDEFLIGEQRKLEVAPTFLTGIDFLLLRSQSAQPIARITPELAAQKDAFVERLNREGEKALPEKNGDFIFFKNGPGFERNNRWWAFQKLQAFVPDGKVPQEVGVLVVTTAMPNAAEKAVSNVALYATTGFLAFLLSALFAAGIAKGINSPLRLLTKRTTDLANQKTNLPPLSSLSGEWLELGETIDNAVMTLRSNIQQLRQQVTKVSFDAEEKHSTSDTTNSQFDALNRQIGQQAKQLTEVSKQIMNANKQAVLLQHKLDAVLQTSTEGFLVLDQFGNVLSANPVFLHWMGATEAEIAGRLCFDLVRKPGEGKANDLQGPAFVKHSGDPHKVIDQFYPEGVIWHRKEARKVEVLAHLQPVGSDDATIEGYIMVLRDKSLRSEIAQLRSDIVSMLSESIRAPIVACETRWTTILRNAPDTMHPSVGQSLTELHKQYEHLLGIIDSLLMVYGGLMPTPIQPRETFAIQRLVADCLEEFTPLARERQLLLDYKGVAGLPNITGNKDAIKAVLTQLIEKVIDVTAAGGRVRVEVHVKGEELRIGVTSSGPALSEGEIQDMFVGFVPGKHSEESYSARLSMYLAGNNIERLGGKAWAESQAGRGTAIFFTIPSRV
jgi:signal transduction histidine kinase